MKNFFVSALTLVSAISLAAGQSKESRAYIMTDDGNFSAYIAAASNKSLRYRENTNSTAYKDLRLASITVYFLEPAEFTEAMELYRSRQYSAALEKFKACTKAYDKVDEVPGNYSTLATFYQMECHRKLGDLEAIGAVLKDFIAKPLLHEQHLLQIELYKVFWDAVRLKEWPRIAAIASDPDWKDRQLAGSLRAQIAYCTGLALEGMDQPIRALDSYNVTFVADFAASEVLTRKAALASLRIITNHEEVKLAMKLFGSDDFSKNSDGAFLLREGIALVKLWDKILGGGEALPADYRELLKYDK